MMSIFAFLFVLFVVDYAKFGAIQSSVMMQMNMMWVYLTVPPAGFGWAVFALCRLWQAIDLFRSRDRTAS